MRRRIDKRFAWLLLLAAVCALPFLGKAFHIDDPFWIWTAKQIQVHPLNFYGYRANWFGTEQWMFEITKTPPLFAYFLWAASVILGWTEKAMHAACFIPAAITLGGSYFLAKESDTDYFYAALLVLVSPVFQICSTNIMSDMMMTGFFVWSVVFWVWGAKRSEPVYYFLSAVSTTLAVLSKYNGVLAIFVILAFEFLEKKRCRKELLFLFIPVGAVGFYEILTYKLYGVGLVAQTLSFTVNFTAGTNRDWLTSLMAGLSFLGGGTGLICFLGFFALKKQKMAGWFVVLVALAFIGGVTAGLKAVPQAQDQAQIWIGAVQTGIWAMGGTSILIWATLMVWRERTVQNGLLYAWLFGTFVFAVFLNWSVTGRAFLPIIVPVAIFATKFLKVQLPGLGRTKAALILLTLVLSTALNYADWSVARSAREFSLTLKKHFIDTGQTVWFQGHWGFQYYMEEIGAKPLDRERPQFKEGDIIVVPNVNAGLFELPESLVTEIAVVHKDVCSWATVFHGLKGAGFYTDLFGPAPFIFGRVPQATAWIYRAKKSVLLRD